MHFIAYCFGVIFLTACDQQESLPITGSPSGPYHMTVRTLPSLPIAGQETIITTQLSYAKNGEPVVDLDILHQRLVHNFITQLDFTAFAHIHNEDFSPLTDIQKATGTLSFPYTFPSNGNYRMVSEFTHQKRSWTKHFDISVGENNAPSALLEEKISHSSVIGDYHARLSYPDEKLMEKKSTVLEILISKKNVPVNNLKLHLGSEAHVAIWRTDGKNFGHTHSYTPKMRELMDAMKHDDQMGSHSRKAMRSLMYKVMSTPEELMFKGPIIPLLHTFPETGIYKIFIECAPDGLPIVFDFTVDVGSEKHDSFDSGSQHH